MCPMNTVNLNAIVWSKDLFIVVSTQDTAFQTDFSFYTYTTPLVRVNKAKSSIFEDCKLLGNCGQNSQIFTNQRYRKAIDYCLATNGDQYNWS